MISLDKCDESCNAIDDLSTIICVPSEVKDVNIEEFNMITITHEAKKLVTNISCDCKFKFISTAYDLNQK